MKKSVIVALLLMLWSLIAGCAYQTYDELQDEAMITGDSTKVERREAEYLKATNYLESKSRCSASIEYTWICTRQHGSPRLRRRAPTSELSVDAAVRLYHTYRSDGCKCIYQSDLRF